MIYHGVENNGAAGIYRSFWALLDEHDPLKILRLEDGQPLLEADPKLTADISHQLYIQDVVFSTGIAAHEDDFILASGESDLGCRITRISKKFFSNHDL
jgi:beta-1,2-mannobiose phosphorylase / 1,2-beta-oligomannan phosphorylase